MAGVVAGVGAGFHWMSLKTRRGSSETKGNLEKVKKKLTITTFGEPGAAPLGFVAGPAPVAAACHRVFGSTSAGERKFRLAKA
jgi:hypothetical protein